MVKSVLAGWLPNGLRNGCNGFIEMNHSAGSACSRDDVFRIGRNSMFRKIHAVGFALGIKAEQAKRIDREHHYQGDAESRDGRDTASDRLGDQELGAAAIKETCQRRAVIRSERSSSSILSCGKE